MPLDPSIFLTEKPRSAFDYLKDMAEVEDAKQNRQLRGLQLLAQQGMLQDAQQARDVRNRGMAAVQALGGGATNEQRISALRAAGDYGTADALEKADLERLKTGATAQKDQAEAEKTQLANLHSKIDRHLQGLTMVNDPQAAMMWLKQGLNDGLMDTQKASAFANQVRTMTPEQFQGWKQQMAAGGISLKDQVEQHFKQITFDQSARNDLIGPDGKINQQLVAAKTGIARAGASNVSVSTEKGLLGQVAEGLGKEIVTTSQGARDAQSTLDAVGRIRTALNSGKAITGTGANQRLLLGQLGYTLGLGDAGSAETLAQTRATIQGLADLSLQGAGSMRGQGQITENERKLLDKAKSGDVTWTEPELRTLMNTFERVAKYQVGRNAANVKMMKANPNAASIVPFLESNGQENATFDLSPDAIEAEAARRQKLRGGK